MNTDFERLILDLYKKQQSDDYFTGNKRTFLGAVVLYGSTYNFPEFENGTGEEFLETHIEDVDSLYLVSNTVDMTKQIQKTAYVSHSYDGDTLHLETRQGEIDFPLK